MFRLQTPPFSQSFSQSFFSQLTPEKPGGQEQAFVNVQVPPLRHGGVHKLAENERSIAYETQEVDF